MIFAVNDGMLMRDVLDAESNQRGTPGAPNAIRADSVAAALQRETRSRLCRKIL